MILDYILGGVTTPADASVTQTSVPKDIGDNLFAAVQAVFTGTPSGVFKLQASLDNVYYADISGSSVTVTTGNPSPIVINEPQAGFRFLRAVWTPVSRKC